MKECPQPVLDLVEHLRSTGTGKSKLEIIKQLGAESEGADDFLEKATKAIPEGTMKKIKEYIGSLHSEVGTSEVQQETPTEISPPQEQKEDSSQESKEISEEEDSPQETEEGKREETTEPKPSRKRR